MRSITCCMTLLALALAASPSAWAEKVPLSKEELEKIATHVVVGKVVAIYTRESKDAEWATTHYVAEIQVQKVEKGDGMKEGELVYARYWNRRWISPKQQPPNTNGHRGLPSVGNVIRAYLAKNAYDGFGETKDGGFNVIGANGFEPAGTPAAK